MTVFHEWSLLFLSQFTNPLLLSSCGGEWEKGFGGSLESIQANPLQWDSMGRCPGQWAPPVYWNFTLEQVQTVEKLVKHLEKVCWCPGYSRETQMIATCWGLAQAYWVLFNFIQYPQGEKKVSGSDDKRTSTAGTPTPVTGTGPENQPTLIPAAPGHK